MYLVEKKRDGGQKSASVHRDTLVVPAHNLPIFPAKTNVTKCAASGANNLRCPGAATTVKLCCCWSEEFQTPVVDNVWYLAGVAGINQSEASTTASGSVAAGTACTQPGA